VSPGPPKPFVPTFHQHSFKPRLVVEGAKDRLIAAGLELESSFPGLAVFPGLEVCAGHDREAGFSENDGLMEPLLHGFNLRQQRAG